MGLTLIIALLAIGIWLVCGILGTAIYYVYNDELDKSEGIGSFMKDLIKGVLSGVITLVHALKFLLNKR